MNLRELVWPKLERPPPVMAGQDAAKHQAELQAIKTATLGKEHIAVLIEEARRLMDAENARRAGADARATTYLAIVGVLIPLVAALAPTVVNNRTGDLRTFVSLGLLLMVGAYLLRCGIWAFEVLKVSTAARVDAIDLIELWRDDDPRVELAKRLLYCVRWGRGEVNDKITGIKMAHAYGVRALAMFVFAMLLRAAWDPVVALARVLGN